LGAFAIHREAWIDRRAARRIWAMVARDPALAETVLPEDTNIYRVPLPERVAVTIEIEDTDARFAFRRSIFEGLGFGHRVYIVDSAPGALFSKETLVVVLRGWGLAQVFRAVAPGGIAINGEPFPLLHAFRLMPMLVHVSALSRDLGQTFAPPDLALDAAGEVTAGPFAGPFPEDDVTGGEDEDGDDENGDDPRDTPPPDAFGEEIGTGTPTYLFYGICFQGKSKVDRFGIRADFLWDQTLAIATAFRRRGYRTRTGLAGHHGPSTPPTDTFNMMMLSLERDIPVTYCNSTRDQMVILIAAHGYGGKYNPTNKVALKYQTVSGRTLEWITHAAFWQRLQQIGAIRRNPAKVRLIFYSCRSGGLFAARPAALRKVGLFTSTADGKTLCYASFFSCLRDGLRNPRVRTWKKLFSEVARCLRAMGRPNPRPRNG